MAEYAIVIKKSAEKEISNLPLAIVEKLYQEFIELAKDPRPHGVKNFKDLRIYIESALATTEWSTVF